jgi:Zn-dependent M28 family amino/carboxypeptidase
MRPHHRISLIILLVGAFFIPASVSSNQPGITISTLEEVKNEFDTVPCSNKDRPEAVKALFRKFGASSTDVQVQKYRDVENLVLIKEGTSTERIVVGAHYDKVDEGCGAIDNWTGIVAVAHLYKSLKNVPTKKTILFVAFGKEERGLIGSRAMVAAISKDQLAQYCDMVNIDSLGLALPQVADNMSSKKLESLVAALAGRMKISFAHATIPNADADSSSFLRRKIPAVTIHGLSENWPSILHSRNDQRSKIKPENVYLGYRLVLALVMELDGSPCAAYR